MTPIEPMNADGKPAACAAVPVYHWRGARPFPLALGERDTGAAVCLLLGREGDACLLPLSRQANVPPGPRTRLGFAAEALDEEALRLTLADLQADGWVVIGRLDVRFTGCFASDDFWTESLGALWRRPTDEPPTDAPAAEADPFPADL